MSAADGQAVGVACVHVEAFAVRGELFTRHEVQHAAAAVALVAGDKIITVQRVAVHPAVARLDDGMKPSKCAGLTISDCVAFHFFGH